MDFDVSLIETSGTTEELPVKVCPVCGQKLFADMEICYGCLHDFRRKPSLPLGFPPTLFARRLDEPPDALDEPPEAPPAPQGGGEGKPPEPPADMVTELLDDRARGGLCLRLQTAEADADVEIGPQGLVIGRSPGCDIVLHARSVSRHHVRVELAGGEVSVEDQGATNPATVEGRPLVGRAPLRVGETLDVCGVRLTLRASRG